jgi:hypothetical protein
MAFLYKREKMSIKKLIISSAALVLTLILSAGVVFAWLSISGINGTVNNTPVELQGGYGATMKFFVYNYNESILSSNSSLDSQFVGDKEKYYETSNVEVIIAPEISAYFLLILEGEIIEPDTYLKMEFIDVNISSYDIDGEFDPDIFDFFKLEFWDGVDEGNGIVYPGEYNYTQKTFIVNNISISGIVNNSSIMFFKYTLANYSNQSATKITMEKIRFSIYQNE